MKLFHFISKYSDNLRYLSFNHTSQLCRDVQRATYSITRVLEKHDVEVV